MSPDCHGKHTPPCGPACERSCSAALRRPAFLPQILLSWFPCAWHHTPLGSSTDGLWRCLLRALKSHVHLTNPQKPPCSRQFLTDEFYREIFSEATQSLPIPNMDSHYWFTARKQSGFKNYFLFHAAHSSCIYPASHLTPCMFSFQGLGESSLKNSKKISAHS